MTFRLIGNSRAAAPWPFSGSATVSAGQFWTVSENARCGFRRRVFDAITDVLHLDPVVADEPPAEVVERQPELGPAVGRLPRVAVGPEPEIGPLQLDRRPVGADGRDRPSRPSGRWSR